ncbi:MAG: helix-turn-helix domain-containing protein [Tissierellia bacterium]|nr:helix-turn-helix domain-containing protein [Tissierellia bacterium]
MAVKNRLKDILDSRGIKQVWLAEQVDISFKTMSNIINNRYNTSLEVALKIADILGMKIDDIFYLEK